MSTADRMARRLDQVDRKSLMTVSDAMRARDVSRPADVAATLEAHESGQRDSPDSGPDQPPVRSSDRDSSGGSSPVSS